jgi:hypothetical protein
MTSADVPSRRRALLVAKIAARILTANTQEAAESLAREVLVAMSNVAPPAERTDDVPLRPAERDITARRGYFVVAP